jgi:hypothetical protein
MDAAKMATAKLAPRALLVLLVVITGSARADEPPTPTDQPRTDDGSRAMGASVGFQTGLGGLAPGGLRLAGTFLYRLTETAWFDGEAAFTFGSGGKSCYLDRQGALACDHGIAGGFEMSLGGGLRWLLEPRQRGFRPHVRAGAALSYVRFGDDDLTGVAFLTWAGAGGTFAVAPRVRVGGEALLRLGPGLYNRDLGLEPLGELVVQFGIEFEL